MDSLLSQKAVSTDIVWHPSTFMAHLYLSKLSVSHACTSRSLDVKSTAQVHLLLRLPSRMYVRTFEYEQAV